LRLRQLLLASTDESSERRAAAAASPDWIRGRWSLIVCRPGRPGPRPLRWSCPGPIRPQVVASRPHARPFCGRLHDVCANSKPVCPLLGADCMGQSLPHSTDKTRSGGGALPRKNLPLIYSTLKLYKKLPVDFLLWMFSEFFVCGKACLKLRYTELFEINFACSWSWAYWIGLSCCPFVASFYSDSHGRWQNWRPWSSGLGCNPLPHCYTSVGLCGHLKPDTSSNHWCYYDWQFWRRLLALLHAGRKSFTGMTVMAVTIARIQVLFAGFNSLRRYVESMLHWWNCVYAQECCVLILSSV